MILIKLFNCSHKGLYRRLNFKPQLWSWSLSLFDMSLLSVLKNRIAQRKRKKMLSIVLNSNLVGSSTESETVIRITEELFEYIRTGRFYRNALPNGYLHQGVRPKD